MAEFPGTVRILDSASNATITLNGEAGAILAGGHGEGGDLSLRDSAGNERVWIRGETGYVLIKNAAGRFLLRFDSDRSDLSLYREIDGSPRPVIGLAADRGTLYLGIEGQEGNLVVRDDAGNTRIHLDGNSGDVRLTGADCAEEFDVVESEEIHAGTVLVIDNEIKLRPCNEAYDKRVAGIVSGGNGSNPGIILDKNPSQNARLPVALNGKVYCKVDAQYSPIEIGDLLTTSPTPGHAMKADEPLKAFGAVIGKALRSLHEGTGMIPVLVALQ